MNHRQVCVISNIEIPGQQIMITAGQSVVYACHRNFLGQASVLLRLAGEESLANVPGIDAPVNCRTKSIRTSIWSWDVEKFLSSIRPHSRENETDWKLKVLGAMILFGPVVRDFSASQLGVSLSSLTEDHRSVGQTGKLPSPAINGDWFSANDIDPKGLRWKRPSIYTSHQV
jgi:hypothetical protein